MTDNKDTGRAFYYDHSIKCVGNTNFDEENFTPVAIGIQVHAARCSSVTVENHNFVMLSAKLSAM